MVIMVPTRALVLAAALGAAHAATTITVDITLGPTTTTVTPWDSSSGSSGASSDSLVSASLNDDSSSVDSSGSAESSGWKQSGSSGSFMNNWLWVALILCLLCVKGGLLAALCKPKPKPKKKPAPKPV